MLEMTLLRRAEDAGLEVVAKGGRIVVRGPKSAEQLGQRILARKDELLHVVEGDWAADAEAVIAKLSPESLRKSMRAEWERMRAKLNTDGRVSRREADMLAFGALLFAIIQAGADVRVAAGDDGAEQEARP